MPIARSFYSIADNGEKGFGSGKRKEKEMENGFSCTDSLAGMGDRCSRESRKGKDREDGKEVS